MGTKEGGQKAAKTNKAKYGSNFYRQMGSLGGRMAGDAYGKNGPKAKGFAADPARASAAGAEGGRISRRGPKSDS